MVATRPGRRGSPTAAITAATASATGTCSHSRTTVQPAAARAASAARSRSTFFCSLGDQYHSLFFGFEPCSGHACQKQPSTNTATLREVNAMSGRTRLAGRSSR
jgi:type IV secretory pathway TrbL component